MIEPRQKPLALQRVLQREPELVRLARLLALAVRIEPALIRQMRFECLPNADVGIESDLWWSGLVQVRDPIAMVLLPDVLEALRSELRQKQWHADLDRAWPVVKAAHRWAPPVVRLEETVVYLALRGDVAELERHLGGVVDALTADTSLNLSRWVARALSRFPEEARKSEPALLLASLASQRLGGARIPGVVRAASGTPRTWSKDLLRQLPKVSLSFQLAAGSTTAPGTDGALSIAVSTSGSGGAVLAVPATTPCIVDVLTPTPEGWSEQRVEVAPAAPRSVDLLMGPAVRVRSLLGDVLLLRPQLPNHRPSVEARGARSAGIRVWLARVLTDLGWELSTASESGPSSDRPNQQTEAFIDALVAQHQMAAPSPEQKRAIRAHLLERDRERFSSWLDQPTEGVPSHRSLAERRQTHFVLWRPSPLTSVPRVVISPIGLEREEVQHFELEPSDARGLWELSAHACLEEGRAYRYWFEVEDTARDERTHRAEGTTRLVTDPFAWTIDRLASDGRQPAALVKLRQGRLRACHPDGATAHAVGQHETSSLAPNSRMVIYHVPVRNFVPAPEGTPTFDDIAALLVALDEQSHVGGGRVPGRTYQSHLAKLGINALQIRAGDPQVQSAPHADLGTPSELAALIDGCHRRGVRFLVDLDLDIWGFGAYRHIAFDQFLLAQHEWGERDGFGYDVLDYQSPTESYDPLSGDQRTLVPARRLMLSHLTRWIADFRVDGVWISSLNNVGNPDFVREFRDQAWRSWQERTPDPVARDQGFIVMGEDLAAGGSSGPIDALWTDGFKVAIRALISGRELAGSFEHAVRELIAPRMSGTSDGSQRINYLGSAFVAGFENERIASFLKSSGVEEPEPRLLLAFACLMTAVGIPLILAGDEFGSEAPQLEGENMASFQFERDWRPDDAARARLFDSVSRLVHLRTQHDALASNVVSFIHFDFEGKRVMVWQRGAPENPVIVVANFSDWSTQQEYAIPSFPRWGWRAWREVIEDRLVPPERAGREPIRSWDAKVYVPSETEIEPWGRFNGQNVLVAGTGRFDLAPAELWTASALGAALARNGFGLVTGGWRGVDHVAAKGYYDEARKLDGTSAGYLLQVVEEGRIADFPGGAVRVVSPTDVYDEAISNCAAVVLIGGHGGTLEVFRRAKARSVPVFPILATGGDAAAAFDQTPREDHQYAYQARAILSTPITSSGAATELAEALVPLIFAMVRSD